jgi:hypothetical protein
MHKNVYFGSEVMLLCFAQLFGFWEVVTLSIARVTPLSMDVTPLSMKGKPTWRNGLHNRASRKILGHNY